MQEPTLRGMWLKFQPPRSGLVSYQGADTTSATCCTENYRPALHGKSKGRYMLSPVLFSYSDCSRDLQAATAAITEQLQAWKAKSSCNIAGEKLKAVSAMLSTVIVA